jgi:ankyrin repeat protein
VLRLCDGGHRSNVAIQFDNYIRLVEETKTLSPEELTAKVSAAEQIRNDLWQKTLAEETVAHPDNPREARKTAEAKQSEAISSLNPETKFYLDFPAAMSSIGLYQESSTTKYSHIFGSNPDMTIQSNAPIIDLLSPAALDRQGGMINPASLKENDKETFKQFQFSGGFSDEDLTKYLSSLAQVVADKSFDQPVTLLLCNSAHAISIGYDPTTKSWMLVDANKAMQRTNNIEDVGNYIRDAYADSFNPFVAFTTQIITTRQNLNSMREVAKAWHDHPDMKQAISMTDEKVNAADKHGSWLYCATYFNEAETVDKLLAAKADINKLLYNADFTLTRSVMIAAVSLADIKTVDKLVQAGGDINGKLDNGMTPLFAAVSTKNAAMVQYLLAHTADPNAVITGINVNCLHQAACTDNKEIVSQLLTDGRVDVNAGHKIGVADLLETAKKNGCEEGVKVWILKHHDNNMPAEVENFTALHWAILNKNQDMSADLIRHGADMRSQNSHIRDFAVAVGLTKVAAAQTSTPVKEAAEENHVKPRGP